MSCILCVCNPLPTDLSTSQPGAQHFPFFLTRSFASAETLHNSQSIFVDAAPCWPVDHRCPSNSQPTTLTCNFAFRVVLRKIHAVPLFVQRTSLWSKDVEALLFPIATSALLFAPLRAGYMNIFWHQTPPPVTLKRSVLARTNFPG